MFLRFALPLIFAGASLLTSCNSAEIKELRAENDSLRNELQVRQEFVTVMRDVQSLIDSIDSSRRILRTSLTEGTSVANVTSRLEDINRYIQMTVEKIASLEKNLKVSSNEANAYLMMVDALKGEVEIRESEIQALEDNVASLQQENSDLLQVNKFQEAELADMQSKVTAKQQELRLLEAKVDQMVQNLQISEAEALYARARAVEEAARRTKLAPSKKKETYREALELYKKAYSLGKQEARQNISELEKKI